MMSGEDSQVPIWSYRVNLDKRVRSDHPLRRIRAPGHLGGDKPGDRVLVKAMEHAAKEQVQKVDEEDDDEDPPSEGGGGPGPPIGGYPKANRQFRSTTDPDATLVRHGGLKSR